MPAYESPMPVSATNPKIVHNGETYNLVLGTDTFERVGKDGNIPILPLFGGDEFVGEVLEGHWKKGWDAGMDADQAFTAILDGSGTLEFEGEADVAGVNGFGWINGHLPIPLLNGIEITVSMSVPVDDTGAIANRDIFFDFYLRKEKKSVSVPTNEPDFIRVRFDVDENGLFLVVSKEINTANTVLDSGHDYTMDVTRGTGDLEAVIWRFVIHDGVAGATSPEDVRHMHVYMKQSDTIANAESATENELDDSPYDISDLEFNVAYPTLQIISGNTTYYDAGNEAKVGYVRVDYPNHNLRYDFVDANYGWGDVELWDGDPDVATSQRVYDEDHEFTSDPYLQNGLLRLHIDEGTITSIDLYGYIGAAWVLPLDQFLLYLVDESLNARYAYLKNVVKVSAEEVILNIRLHDSAVENNDYYIDTQWTLKRGNLLIELEVVAVYPIGDMYINITDATKLRFGWAGTVKTETDLIADDDVTTNARNATLADNLLIALDDAGPAALFIISADEKPTEGSADFFSLDGSNMGIANYLGTALSKFWVGITPFSQIANLFEEAEDGTLGGGATTPGNDPLASGAGNNYVLLDAQNELVYIDRTAGTHLPEGRYLFIARMLDTNQIADDIVFDLENVTDASKISQTNGDKSFTLTAAYAYYAEVFDVSAADVSGTDVLRFYVKKNLADANAVRVDYLLIIPIGDGESFPQDLAHAALRDKDQPRRLYER